MTRAWLTRRRSGESYLLTRHPPVIARVEGTRHTDAYLEPGEPVGVTMCAVGVEAEIGRELPKCEPRPVEYSLRLMPKE